MEELMKNSIKMRRWADVRRFSSHNASNSTIIYKII